MSQSIEVLVTNLIAALEANTAALKGGKPVTTAAAPAAPVKKAAPAPVEDEEPSADDDAPPAPAPKAKKVTPPAEKKAPKAAEPEAEDEGDLLGGDEAPAIDLKALREAGMKVIKAGKSSELKAILEKYSVESLSALPEDKFGEVHAKIVKIKV